MKHILLILVFAFSVTAQAVEFEINHHVYGYDMTNSKTKPDSGESTETKTTTLHSYNTNLELGIHVDRFTFYAYPLNPGSSLALSYNLDPSLEIGGILGHESSTTEDENDTKSEVTSTTIGVFIEQTFRLDPRKNLELGALVSHNQSEGKITSDAVTSKSNSTGQRVFIDADLVFKLYRHFNYICGIKYQITSSSDKELDQKTDTSTLSLKLAAFRYRF